MPIGRPTGEAEALDGSVDTHTHLNHPRLRRRLAEVLARARGAGIAQMIVVGYDLPSSRAAVELAEEHPGLWAAVGVHPHEAATVEREALGCLRGLAKRDRVVAIGETGLDFDRDLSPRSAQMAAFREHLELAGEMDLPVIVHCREAQEALLEVLSAHGDLKLVWHCFDGSREQAERALGLGMTLGFGGMLTYKRAEELRAVIAEVPLDRILLETDCPYLAPEPKRGRDNEPANLPIIAECAAKASGRSRRQMEEVTAENARRVFDLDDGCASS